MESYNGYLYLLKPAGMTSFDLVNYVRRRLGVKKAGHTGTLDPNAMGVMVVCVGRGTRAIPYFEYDRKSYRAELTLGIATDTEDTDGQVIGRDDRAFTDTEIRDAVASFVGPYSQVPPMFSAIKIDGQKMYEAARKGQVRELPSRDVEVFGAEVREISVSGGLTRVLFDVSVSKGTYIRSLCRDIGRKLGSCGCMSYLYRTSCGGVRMEDCLSLRQFEEILAQGAADGIVEPLDSIFRGYGRIQLTGRALGKASNGVPVEADIEDGKYRVYGEVFMGIGEARDGFLRMEKRFDT